MITKSLKIIAVTSAALGASGSGYALAQTDKVNEAVQMQAQVDQQAAETQKTINSLKDQTLDSAGRYAQAMAEAESFEQYNERLGDQVKSQEDELASIQKQLDDIGTTSREVEPLMQNMLQSLDRFVSLDVPFLLDERRQRIQKLKDLMQRADVSISEKYRLILEAYQIELDYGSSLEAYQGKLGDGPDARTVQFVRLGRISLMYQTLDGSETGYWDANQKKWVRDDSYAGAVEQALKVANGHGAPELLTLPVPTPQEASL